MSDTDNASHSVRPVYNVSYHATPIPSPMWRETQPTGRCVTMVHGQSNDSIIKWLSHGSLGNPSALLRPVARPSTVVSVAVSH